MGSKLWSCAALVAASLAGCKPATDFDQGWTANQIKQWSSGYQGSRLLPEAWLWALEQPDSAAPFLDAAYIGRFRYLPVSGGLPLGFAVDQQDDTHFIATRLTWKRGQTAHEPWVGMTCAACHTNDIRFGNRSLRVYGGATLADFQSFVEALNTALARTRDDPAKFERFARGVLGAAPSADDTQLLRQALGQLIAYQQKIAAQNQTPMRYGYGRLDAVGYIYNKIAMVAKPDGPSQNAPDAPVSYPFLWNTAQQTQVQWNGIARNMPGQVGLSQTIDPGALLRNLGEVTGVFGEVIAPPGPQGGYISSVHVDNLVAMEQLLMQLKPPKWRRDLFPVDAASVSEGRGLYQTHCVACHVVLPRGDLHTRQRPGGGALETMSYFNPQNVAGGETKVDTDPWMACNGGLRQANTGLLNGRPVFFDVKTRFTATSAVPTMLGSVAVGLMVSRAAVLGEAALESLFHVHPGPQVIAPVRPRVMMKLAAVPAPPLSEREQRRKACEKAAASSDYRLFAYKARPLTGVWATAPYLHNGSVPTLYDLLLPPAQRPTTFNLGSRAFDARHVGFITAPSAEANYVFSVKDASGEVIPGNSNQGHDYGNATFTEHQRLALVEYLKVIGE